MIKTKKQMFIIIGVFALVLLLGSVSYAWFSYRAETGNSELVAGDIYMHMTEGNETLTLTNVFPETVAEARARDDNYITFEISGLNTSNKTIYYEILLNHGDDKPSPKSRYTDSDLRFDLVELDSNGDEVTYVVDAGKYDSLIDKRIWVDTIDASTTNEVSKKYKLRAWLSDNVIISDTEPNANYNTTEFPNKYATIKVKVNGDFTEKDLPGAYNKIKKNVNTTTQINFAQPSTTNNGQGVYILPGTENDTNPIYYYRGAVDNNNVVFAGFCWQVVRTTETGGIKMIYNGLPDISLSGNNITYNCGTTRDIQDTIRTTTTLQESTGYYYADDYEIVNTAGNSVTYKLKAGTNSITQVAINDVTEAATNIPTIAINYPYTCKATSRTTTCTTLYKVDSYASGTNANVYSSLDRSIIDRSVFNAINQSASDVGYMSNTRFPNSISGWTTGALFASMATWVTDHYELTDASVTTPDATHHYSCNATTSDATCTSLKYVFYVSGVVKYYITLTNGDLVEDALYKMTGTGSNETKTKNSAYNLNVNNSTAKTVIDNWFRTNLTNEVNVNNPNYSVYLEDTVYCNDRSFKTTGSSNTYTQSSWNLDGEDLSTSLYFGANNRYDNSWYSTNNVPTVKDTGEVPNIACPNKNDRFTVSSTVGNGALTYPVGLLTEDEMILAGVGGNNSYTSTYYLNTNDYYWTMTPFRFDFNAHEFTAPQGGLVSRSVNNNISGLRPVVSLRHETEFEIGGDGTPTNPYIVKYN